MASAGGGHSNNISVSIRLRPLNEREREAGCEFAWDCTLDTVELKPSQAGPRGLGPFSTSCDRVFGPEMVENEQVYRIAVQELVAASLEGINGTLLRVGCVLCSFMIVVCPQLPFSPTDKHRPARRLPCLGERTIRGSFITRYSTFLPIQRR